MDRRPMATARPVPFRQVLLKVHSRCNLACDYCYVYEHADQSWRQQPRVMSQDTVDLAAKRVAEHAEAHGLDAVTVILHGGEPLLAGPELFEYCARAIRGAAGEVTVRLGVQTNGLLLDERFLEVFLEHDYQVGISIDGGLAANDRHRRHADGRSSHAGTVAAVERIRQARFRHLYGGLLCVVDLANDPVATYQELVALGPPQLDLLLPHGNWSAPPPGLRAGRQGTPYADWLIAVFDRWYGRQETEIRLFSAIIVLLFGGRSRLETLGLDPVDIVTVETDGSLQQGDVLKTTVDGMAATGLTLAGNSFDDAAGHPGIQARQQGLDGLSAGCRACPVVTVCGGGLYAHRYRAGDGFDNPSVFCADLYALIRHIQDRVGADIDALRRAEQALA